MARHYPAYQEVGPIRTPFGYQERMLTRRYQRYIATLSPNGTIRVCLAKDVRAGEQRITSFRAYDNGRDRIRAALVGDWIYRNYDC